MLLLNVDNPEANHGRCNPCSSGEDLIKTLRVVQMKGWTQNVRQGSQQFVILKQFIPRALINGAKVLQSDGCFFALKGRFHCGCFIML